jgi:hypothetical protein
VKTYPEEIWKDVKDGALGGLCWTWQRTDPEPLTCSKDDLFEDDDRGSHNKILSRLLSALAPKKWIQKQ